MTNTLTADGTVTININVSSEFSSTGCAATLQVIASSPDQQPQEYITALPLPSSTNEERPLTQENKIESTRPHNFQQPPQIPPKITAKSVSIQAPEQPPKVPDIPQKIRVESTPIQNFKPPQQPQPLPTITITPSTPQGFGITPAGSNHPPSYTPTKFTEWSISTRQTKFVLFTPKTSPDPAPKYCMHTPQNSFDRLKRNHTLHLGFSTDGEVVGFTRELPRAFLFTVGNPIVPGISEPTSTRWPLENDIYKHCGVGKSMKWEFKGDLTKYGRRDKYVWVRTKTSFSGLGIEEMECRNGKGMVVAAWSRGSAALRGRLWARKGREWGEGEEAMKVARMRWEVAILLTWRLMIEWSIEKGDSRPKW